MQHLSEDAALRCPPHSVVYFLPYLKAQGLRALALTADLASVPSSHVGQLTVTITPIPGNQRPPFVRLRHQVHPHMADHTHTRTP